MSTTSSYRRYVPTKEREENQVVNSRKNLNTAGEAKATGTRFVLEHVNYRG